jgi:hypothetical protein
MKNLFAFLLLCTLAISSAFAQKPAYFGEKITAKGAVASEKLSQMLTGKESLDVKITGKIKAVCQKKGCWMKVDMGNNQTMMVKFKDYGFFVPLDATGKTSTMQGVIKKEVIDVAALRHYAEDAGKSKEEIEKITEPEEKYTFEAVGVIIK